MNARHRDPLRLDDETRRALAALPHDVRMDPASEIESEIGPPSLARSRGGKIAYVGLSEAARTSGISKFAIANRLRAGKTLEEAVAMGPARPKRKTDERARGRFTGARKASRESGLPFSTILGRLQSGKTLDEAVAMGPPMPPGARTSRPPRNPRPAVKARDAAPKSKPDSRLSVAALARNHDLSKYTIRRLMKQTGKPLLQVVDDLLRERYGI